MHDSEYNFVNYSKSFSHFLVTPVLSILYTYVFDANFSRVDSSTCIMFNLKFLESQCTNLNPVGVYLRSTAGTYIR